MKTTKTSARLDDGSAPPLRLRVRLVTAEDVRKEMAKLYREARAFRLLVPDASKLCNMLATLSRAIENGDIEKRLDALEAEHARNA